MARPATGSVLERPGKTDVSFAIRFRAYGKREQITLGTRSEGWTKAKAESELSNVLADVRRGIWQPYEPEPVEAPCEVPTFHEFATEWLRAREPELKPKTIEDYAWTLSYHLLPAFKDFRLTAITAEEIDRFKGAKLKEKKIAPAQINKCLNRLSQILEVAIDYGHIPTNPAASRGGRRRVKAEPPRRTWVEPEQLLTLLESAPKGHRPTSPRWRGRA